jgi:hypothetical protein
MVVGRLIADRVDAATDTGRLKSADDLGRPLPMTERSGPPRAWVLPDNHVGVDVFSRADDGRARRR